MKRESQCPTSSITGTSSRAAPLRQLLLPLLLLALPTSIRCLSIATTPLPRPAFRAAVFQCRTQPSAPQSVLLNLQRATDALRRAADHNVELVVFPELFLQGYSTTSGSKALDREAYELNVIGQLCQEFGTACILPFKEKPHESETTDDATAASAFSSAAAYHFDGSRAGTYRKISLAPTTETTNAAAASFRTGERLVEALPISIALPSIPDGVKCGIVMSSDLWTSPEHCRRLVRSGAELLLVAGSMRRNDGEEVEERVARHVVPSRALENGVHVLCANYEGACEGGGGFVGLSAIVSPSGEELIRAPVSDPRIKEEEEEEEDVGRVVMGVEGSSVIPCEGGELYVSSIQLDDGGGMHTYMEEDDASMSKPLAKPVPSKGFGSAKRPNEKIGKRGR